jgi:hydroxymethylpyrimidine/phosphomethylpyrimidine kinase
MSGKTMKNPIRLLTIAGSDPSGGAGIQADLKTFGALGCYGMSVVTALTAQNTCGVTAIHEVPPSFVAAQLDAVLEDIGVDAVKIGMLHRREIVEVVARHVTKIKDRPIVLDPVMIAKGGHRLLSEDAVGAIKRLLLPVATIVTPNIPETTVLTKQELLSEDDYAGAANKIHDLGARAVVIKGGHGGSETASDDFLSIRDECGHVESFWLRSTRIKTKNTHGTGCTFSSAIAAFLGHGEDLRQAVRSAKNYVACTIEAAKDQQIGHGHGPVDHFPR